MKQMSQLETSYRKTSHPSAIPFNMAVKSSKKTVCSQYHDLNLDFLKTKDEETDVTQIEMGNLRPEGQRVAEVESGSEGGGEGGAKQGDERQL